MAVHDCGWEGSMAFVATESVEGAEPLRADLAPEPSAPVDVTSGATREPLAGPQPLAAPVSPVAVLSSPGAQRFELALAACCLAAVAWAANLLVGGSSEAVSATLTQVRAPVVSASPERPAAPPVPAAALPAAALPPEFAVPVPATVDVPVGPQPVLPAPVPQQFQHPPAPPAAAPSPAPAPLAAPPADLKRRLAPPAPAAQHLVRAGRQAPPKPVARVIRQVPGPEFQCQHGLALTRDICVAMYCQSIEYRRTAYCVRLHAQRRHVTGLHTQPHGGS